ncbi:MAG: hypothetical protein QHH02_09380, partial [Syntrophomonadaceae bacterium]|nr:hypothetical protein [Syntrophomonadaceae bacterium]
MKIRTASMGQNLVTIIDRGSKVAYSYLPDMNMAMKVGYEGAEEVASPDEYSEKIDPDRAMELEAVVYDGAKCRVISIQDPVSKA